MKAQKLRIGNWVIHDGKVITINSGYEIDEYDGQYKPIPLTEEWLLKFGFSFGELTNHAELEISARIKIRFIEGAPNQLDLVQDNERISMRWGCCYYVHQLQNLYFALTGEELQVK